MNLYDILPYPALIHGPTHPDRLAVTGRLLGLRPAAPDRCRVLELGCGPGSNLIAMADLLPHSEFLGIDLSARQVEDGRRAVAELGLANVELRQGDILELPEDLGEFDYIIVHGVYSWVPEAVRRRVLRLIRRNLAPQGIAYVSYNAYPGWYPMRALREEMLYRIRGIDDPFERARTAQEFIGFLADSFPGSVAFFADFVRGYYSSYLGRGEAPESKILASLSHDEIADINEPLYFHEFAEQAGAADLAYLAEVDLLGSTPVGLPPQVVEALRSFPGGLVETEQYLDFVRNRSFRRTLLCQKEARIERSLNPSRETLRGFHLASQASPQPQNGGAGGAVSVSFVARDGLAFSTDHALTRAAFLHLGKVYPMAVSFERLLKTAAAGAYDGGPMPAGDGDVLASNLLRAFLFGRSLVELYVSPRPVRTRPGRRPRAPALARYLARRGLDSVANVRHETVGVGGLGLKLLPLLDGAHDLEAMALALHAPVAVLRAELRWLARAGLLIE